MELYSLEYWKAQIKLSKDFLRDFQEKGQVIDTRYRGEEERETLGAKKVNMFWANTGILGSALYGNPPRPVVQREFQDPMDDIARVASHIIQRLLQTGPGGSSDDMHNAFMHSVQDRLIPGLGQVWLRYDAKVIQINSGPGMPPIQRIMDESAPTDYVHWCDFFWEPCRVWEECGWAARRVWMSKEKFERRFPDYKGEVNYKIHKDNVAYEATQAQPSNESQRRAEVFEIWSKNSGTVYWMADGASELLDMKPDPLRLRSFYPCPRPLMANVTTAKMLPRADYTMVQDQYAQLDELNMRISLLVEACKAVGVYNKTNEGIQRMLNQGVENQLIPVDNWAMFAEAGGLKGTMDWLPIEQVAAVIQRLREQVAATVQQIYELTGLSDIMRGISEPRETLGAQKLKAQYSSSRLQLYQLAVATFVTEAMQIKAEIIAKHWQPQSIIQKSLIMSTSDAPLAMQAVQLIKNSWELWYRINVSSTQLSIPDYNAEKEARMEFVTTVGQFVAQITPMVEKNPQSAPFFLKMLQWAAATFQKSGEMESIIDDYVRQVEQKVSQPPPGPSPMQQAELEKTKSEAAENYATAQEKQARAQSAGAQVAVEQMQAQGDIATNQAKAQNEIASSQAKTQATVVTEQLKQDTALVKAQASVAQALAKSKGGNDGEA